jgi:hypothetical protein
MLLMKSAAEEDALEPGCRVMLANRDFIEAAIGNDRTN